MNERLGDALAAVLFTGILTSWASGYWPVALVQTCAFLLTAAWLVWMLSLRKRVSLELAFFPLAAIAAGGVAQLAAGATVYPSETVKAVLYWTAGASIFLLGSGVCMAARARNRLLRGVMWFGFVVSLLVTVQYFTSGGRVFWLFPAAQVRVLGPFLYKNQCAAFVELVFPIAVYQSLIDRRHSPLYLAMAATMFAAAITAASRAGLVLVVSELAAILILARTSGRVSSATLGRATLRLGAVGLALAGVVGGEVTLEKFREPQPYRVRRELLFSSLHMIRDRPWTGFGLGTWPTVYPAYARFDNGLAANHAHNDWAEWAAEGGLPLIALMALVGLWSIRPAADSLWGIGVPAVFAHSLVDYPLREPALAALMFAIMGALAARASQLSRAR
ncbi:MAG TPA: O-antigen ligase family protein [Bryobacteraceae bacterium]|nr:O-antigen ligase family protein [Bryobacteraceae bacterium]